MHITHKWPDFFILSKKYEGNSLTNKFFALNSAFYDFAFYNFAFYNFAFYDFFIAP